MTNDFPKVAVPSVLYEDNHLLALDKPAGLPTMGVAAAQPSAVAWARRYLKEKYHKPGQVYLGVVSRLDAVATGVLLLARTSKAAARLTEQFRARQVEKTYWAVIEGALEPPAGELVDWLVKDERQQRMVTTSRHAAGAAEARLQYVTRAAWRGGAWLEISLETGRKHQIRVQLAARGAPLVGDRKYGARGEFSSGIALHARRLVLEHPVRRTPLELIAPLPAAWRRFPACDPPPAGARDA